MARTLAQVFGFDVKRSNGHVMGCGCTYCRNETNSGIASIHERRSRGVGGYTLIDVFLDSQMETPLHPGERTYCKCSESRSHTTCAICED